jgi:mono/diheme cytochrome c family protein
MQRRAASIRTFIISSAAAGILAGCQADGLIMDRKTGTGGNVDPNSNTMPPPTVVMPPPAMGMQPAPTPVPPMQQPTTPPPPPMSSPGVVPVDMNEAAYAILAAKCSGCHTYGQADPAGWGSVLDVSRMIDSDIIVPGDPNASRLIDRVAVVGDMPPKGERLKAAEVEALRTWISAMRRETRTILSDTDVLDEISRDQLRLRDRSSDYRYISFAHYVGQGRSEQEMEAVRQVFSFTLNSLSRRGEVVEATPIDPDRSIFRFQLADLGWDEELWDQLASFYPYCIRSDAAAHEALYLQLDTEAPVVRGDWFMATATKAPLYDLLIDLPDTVDQLAARLGIDINDNINHLGQEEPDNLVRIGFRRSGVALHNRMLERHLGNQGQYLWISYDFDSNLGRADLLANPLGPDNRDQRNFEHTFQHAGGEVIYTMPNGMQGYMLLDAAGNKLSVAPINVVRDPNRRNGVVENGISCYGCHGTVGMLRPRDTDEVARYADTHIANFDGDELEEIEVSYPRVLRPDVFSSDGNRYKAIAQSVPGGAFSKTEGPYLPYLGLIGQYESNVGFRGAAAEFGEEYASFRERVLANDFQNDVLPRTPTAPLVLRDDFVCIYRDLAPKIRANAEFCAGTFTADEVVNLCD